MGTKDDITKPTKFRSLQYLRGRIPGHVKRGTEFHRCLLLRDPISDEIISDMNVSIRLATWSSFVLLQCYGALAILIVNIFMDLVSLLFQEVLGPDHQGQEIVHSEKVVLSWTLSVKFLFAGLNIGPSVYHGHKPTSVSPHILVHRKYCINIPLYISIFFHWQDQW